MSVCYDKDIALLKTKKYLNTNFLPLSDSDKVQISDNVIVVGYPLGTNNIKVTRGIISGREENYFQTDAPINSGNSGGPLLNENHQVIGINNAKIIGNSVEGVGYSIPIQEFLVIENEMINEIDTSKSNGTNIDTDTNTNTNTNKSISNLNIIFNPDLYCNFQNNDNKLQKFYCRKYLSNNENTNVDGYIVLNLFENSPLSNSGVENLDILMEFDNLKLDNNGDISVPWNPSKVNVTDVLHRYGNNKDIPIKYFSIRKNEIVSSNIRFENKSLYGIKNIFHSSEIDYVVFGGMVICQLTTNHINQIVSNPNITSYAAKHLTPYLLKKNNQKPRVFISSVLPGSCFDSNRNVSVGLIIDSINCQKVYTISDVINALGNEI